MASRSKAASTDWITPERATIAIGAVANAASYTALDHALTDPTTAQAYGRGAIFGIRGWVNINTVINPAGVVDVDVLVLPTGMAVPALLTSANRKAAELYHWFSFQLRHEGPGFANFAYLSGKVEIKSSRRYNMSDRLVVVVTNRTGAAFGATALLNQLWDAFVRED